MQPKYRISILAVAIFLLLLLIYPISASNIVVYPGERVELSGGATGSNYVYLFVTGPNLASNGVSLEDVTQEVVTGDASSFVWVPVRNNRWSYKWETQTSGGVLDYGTYVVYIVDRPVGRHDLSDAEYTYKTVQLKAPSVSAYVGTQTPQTPQTLQAEETPRAESTQYELSTQTKQVSQTTWATYTPQTTQTTQPSQALQTSQSMQPSDTAQSSAKQSGNWMYSTIIILSGLIAAIYVCIKH